VIIVLEVTPWAIIDSTSLIFPFFLQNHSFFIKHSVFHIEYKKLNFAWFLALKEDAP